MDLKARLWLSGKRRPHLHRGARSPRIAEDEYRWVGTMLTEVCGFVCAHVLNVKKLSAAYRPAGHRAEGREGRPAHHVARQAAGRATPVLAGAMTVPSRAAASVRLFLLRCIHSVYLMHLAFAEALRSLQMRLWLRRSALSAAIPRVPAHLGLALGDEPIDMRKLADLVGWCAELGIHRITLCDAHGMLLQARE